jgi:hypothetical protein
MKPSSQPQTVAPKQETAARFRRLAAEWKAERGAASSMTRMAMHPTYQQIIGMGPDAVPLILAELEREPDHWFWALHAITGADPVPEQSRGKVVEMADAWVQWGREQGYATHFGIAPQPRRGDGV